MDALVSPLTISRGKNLFEELHDKPNAVTKYVNYVKAKSLDQ